MQRTAAPLIIGHHDAVRCIRVPRSGPNLQIDAAMGKLFETSAQAELLCPNTQMQAVFSMILISWPWKTFDLPRVRHAPMTWKCPNVGFRCPPHLRAEPKNRYLQRWHGRAGQKMTEWHPQNYLYKVCLLYEPRLKLSDQPRQYRRLQVCNALLQILPFKVEYLAQSKVFHASTTAKSQTVHNTWRGSRAILKAEFQGLSV